MLSASLESCDEACSRISKGSCYEEGMRAIGDATQFKYVADKLFGDGVLNCASYGLTGDIWAPGVAASVYCFWSPDGSSCSGSVSSSIQRFCCCGDSNNMCQLEY